MLSVERDGSSSSPSGSTKGSHRCLQSRVPVHFVTGRMSSMTPELKLKKIARDTEAAKSAVIAAADAVKVGVQEFRKYII